jgi:hypothetical protein
MAGWEIGTAFSFLLVGADVLPTAKPCGALTFEGLTTDPWGREQCLDVRININTSKFQLCHRHPLILSPLSTIELKLFNSSGCEN